MLRLKILRKGNSGKSDFPTTADGVRNKKQQVGGACDTGSTSAGSYCVKYRKHLRGYTV